MLHTNQVNNKIINQLMNLLPIFVLFFSPLFRGKQIVFLLVIQFIIFFINKSYRIISKFILICIIYIFIVYLLYIPYTSNKWMTTYFFITLVILVLNYINYKNFFYNINKKNLILFLKKIAFVGNIISVYAFIEHFMGYNPIFYRFFPEPWKTSYSYQHYIDTYRINGSVGHPIPMADLLIVIFFFNIILYKYKKKKIYIIFLLINSVSIIFTYSRGAYISIIITLTIYEIIKLIKNKKIDLKTIIISQFLIAILIIMIILAIKFNNKFFLSILNRFNNINEDVSFLQRSQLISFAINQLFFSNNYFNLMFGYGLGSVSNFLSQNQIIFVLEKFYVFDNQFITFFYELGVIGIISIVAIIATLFKNLILIKGNNPFFSLITCSLLSLIINQIFYDGVYYWVLTNFLISLIMALSNYFYEKDDFYG